MKELYLIIQSISHRLISTDGIYWELASSIDQWILRATGSHSLDYWQTKGVIINEEERKA